MLKIGIYKITSPSGKMYIGQSTNIERRIVWYIKNRCKNQPKLYNSLLKYGWSNHQFEILEECEESKLNELEIWWKLFYNSVENGLNCNYWDNQPTRGRKRSEETKQKISQANKGNKHNEEIKLKISKSNIGKKRSEEFKQYIKNFNIGNQYALGNKLSEETCKKISESKKGHECYKNPERGRKISETKRLKKLK